MHQMSNSLALASVLSTASAAFTGFNYGNKFSDGTLKVEADYKSEFTAAQNLEGTNGAFNSARLYTMLQEGTSDEPIQAISAAIDTDTSLLLGLWASAGEDSFNNELAALQKAIDTYGDELGSRVAGISIGSEDLYRISPIGIANDEYAGADPDTLVKYIGQVRDLIEGTALEGAKLGHVDTWTAYANTSNKAVIEACDWVGMDAYPYFESTLDNDIANAQQLFQDALDITKGASGDKEIWITETGWPVSGEDQGDAVASTENAEKFWQAVGCPMFGSDNVWWYAFQDANPITPSPSFGVIGSDVTTKPLYDLSCDSVTVPDDDDEEDDDETDNGTGDANDEDDEVEDETDSDLDEGSDSNDDSDSSSDSTSGSGSNSVSGSGSSSNGTDSSSADSGSDSTSDSTDSSTVEISAVGRLSISVSMTAVFVAFAALL